MEKYKVLGLALITVFAPVKAAMLTALALILVDLITGIIASIKKKEKVTSAAFGRTIVKTLVYQIAIMLGFLTEKFLTGDLVPVSKIITSYIGLTELTSVIENLNVISGGSLMQVLVNKLGSVNGQKQQ